MFLLIISVISTYNPGSGLSSYCSKQCTLPEKNIFLAGSKLCDCNLPSTTVTFDGSLTTIASFTFNKVVIGTIKIHEDIDTISEAAFYECEITNLNFEKNNIVSIGNGAFYHTTIKNANGISFTNNLKSIGNAAFELIKVKNIDLLAADISSVGQWFQEANIEGTVKLPTKTQSISQNAFAGSKINVLDLSTATDFESISNQAFASLNYGAEEWSPTNIQTINFPSSLNTINSNAFQGCTINSLDLSETDMTILGSSSFKNSIITTSIKLPKKLETISNNAFENAKITDAISFPDTLEKINQKAFLNADINPILTLPDNLETIGDNAFEGTKISSIVFPTNSKIETIGKSAFANLITLISANNIKAKTIDNNAFENCYNLVAPIEILASGSVNKEAFLNCYKITTLKINPKELEEDDDSTIGSNAFQNSGIQSIEVPYLKSIDSYGFENCSHLLKSSNLEVKTISNHAFDGDINLKIDKINSTDIQDSAFKNCRVLNADIIIDLEGKVGPSSFENCYLLKTLTFITGDDDDKPTIIQEKLTKQTIGSKAFKRSGLTGALIIPLTVTEIGSEAFSYCNKLNSLTILGCDSIGQTIKDKAFYRTGIQNKPLTIPYSVTSIESLAFAYCPFNHLVIQGTRIGKKEGSDWVYCTSIDDDAFYGCGITNLNFEENDVSFTKKTFRGCRIQSLSLGNLTKIPEEAFYGMNTINGEIAIPDTVEEIGNRAFAGCTGIKSISFADSSKITDDKIGEGAFYGCSGLTSVNIPRELTTINQNTFYKCTGLTSITIPKSVTAINKNAFYGCYKLDCELILPEELVTIDTGAFQGCSKLKGSLTIPEYTETIDDYAFDGCTSFDGSLTFGRSIKKIGKYAFHDCSGFKGNLEFSQYIINKQLTIDEGAFYGCSGFSGNLTIPTVATIGKYSFRGCSGFNGSLIIPEEVKAVSEGSFYGCSGFIDEIPTKHLTQLDSYSFYGCSGFTGDLDITSYNSDSIPKYCFYNCRGLNGELKLNQALATVNEYAFYGCSGLKGTLDCSSFTNIYKYGFAGCSQLSGPLNFEQNLQEIDEYAFSDCSGFSDSLTFKVKKLTIGRCAFKGCTGFEKGVLSFVVQSNEEDTVSISNYEGNLAPYYRYNYVLKIGNNAFEKTKFKNVYYLGRFEPDCDYDIGISQIKGIQTSSNYANKTFCNYPLHKSNLSGGAIAGIVIACIVVVAAIVVLIVFLILKNKKNKDKSEGEVEMNQDP